MVMMSLATYQAIDPNNPAVFSSALVTDYFAQYGRIPRCHHFGFFVRHCVGWHFSRVIWGVRLVEGRR